MGFGTRVYSSLNQIDIGLWEGDTLVKFASGKKYRIYSVLKNIIFFVLDRVAISLKISENAVFLEFDTKPV